MPLPGSKVIPDGWEEHHRQVAEGAMTAECAITRGGAATGTFDPVTGRTNYATPGGIYSGPCRVQAASRFALLAQAGEKPTTTRRYLVGLPLAAPPPNINDMVTVTAATDTAMVGLKMLVTDVLDGSLVWERDLVCEVYESTSR